MAEPSGSNYPTTIDDSTSLLADVANQKYYTVSGAHNSTTNTLTMTAAISGVTAPGYLVNGRTGEIVHFAGISGSQFTTVTRGADGTTNAAMNNGDILYHVIAANYHNQMKDAILALEGTWKPESGGLVLNDDGADRNLRVESDTDANAIFLDGGTGYLGVGTATPSHKLDVVGTAEITGATQITGATTVTGALTHTGQHIAGASGNVIRAVITKTGIADNSATAVFTITTTNETDSNDGGAFTCLIHAAAIHNGVATGDNAIVGGVYNFGRAQQEDGTGQNSAVLEPTGGEHAAAESEGGTTKGIAAVTCTVTETSEYVQTVNFTVDLDGSAVTTAVVVASIELIWYGYLTAPVIAAA